MIDKKKSIYGVLWSLVDTLSSQFIVFGLSIYLARILNPADYGVIGVLTIFISLANVFTESGFGNALIRKKDRSFDDLSTAFIVNIIVGLFSYAVLFVAAPFVAVFFGNPILKELLRILAIVVVLKSISIVHRAELTAHLNIKFQAYANLFAQTSMALVAILLAKKGYGVYALVYQQLGSAFILSLLLVYKSSFTFGLNFKKSSFTYLFGFGSKLVLSNLVGTFFNQIYSFVIGKQLGAVDLGIFSNAKNLSEKPRDVLNSVLNRVVLPMMVNVGNDKDRIRIVYGKMIELVAFIAFPMMFAISLVAEHLIHVLLNEKWVASIVYLQIYALGMAWGPIAVLNLNLLQLLNRTDLTLKLELIKKPLLLLLLVCGIPFGLLGIVISATIYNVLATLINMRVSKNLINYAYFDQLKDILKYTGFAAIGVGLSLVVNAKIESHLLALCGNLIVHGTVYLALCFLFKVNALNSLTQLKTFSKGI